MIILAVGDNAVDVTQEEPRVTIQEKDDGDWNYFREMVTFKYKVSVKGYSWSSANSNKSLAANLVKPTSWKSVGAVAESCGVQLYISNEIPAS